MFSIFIVGCSMNSQTNSDGKVQSEEVKLDNVDQASTGVVSSTSSVKINVKDKWGDINEKNIFRFFD